MIFLPKFVHLHGQQFSGVLESFLVLLRFLVKNAKNNILEDKCFLSKMFYQIKMQAATNWSSHLKKHQTFDFLSNDRFFMQFSKIAFFLHFLNSSVAHVKSLYEINFMSTW